MANSQTDFNQIVEIDRLSTLPDALLVTILSLLPTHIAARTSVLCRRFRHLWEACPCLAFISCALPRPPSKNFVAMAKRALLRRNPSHSLLSLRIEVYRCDQNATAMISSLLAKACSLDLRHLTLDSFWSCDFLSILPIIFTINSLRCLSLCLHASHYNRQELYFPSGINLTCLRSLSLRLFATDLADLNPLLSELCSLEDLYLRISGTPGLGLFSKTIRKLTLIITTDFLSFEKIDNVALSLPSLELLHLETCHSLRSLSYIHGKVPLLRKAVIKLHSLDERDVSVVDGLLNWISHVEELSLHLKENKICVSEPIGRLSFHAYLVTYGTIDVDMTDMHLILTLEYPIPILLESGKDVPKFSNLKHLDVTLCFHEQNFEAVTMLLHNCSALKSLKLVHEIPYFTGLVRGQKRKDWQSKLPRNADGNYCYAYFRNLHLEEDKKEFMKLLRKVPLRGKLVTRTCYSPAK